VTGCREFCTTGTVEVIDTTSFRAPFVRRRLRALSVALSPDETRADDEPAVDLGGRRRERHHTRDA
jgi:hypothetical protein